VHGDSQLLHTFSVVKESSHIVFNDDVSGLWKVVMQLSRNELCCENDRNIMQVAEQRREVVEENR